MSPGDIVNLAVSEPLLAISLVFFLGILLEEADYFLRRRRLY